MTDDINDHREAATAYMRTAIRKREIDHYLGNRREMRGRMMAAAVLAEIQDLVPDDALPEVHDRLMAAFVRNGLSVIDDRDRERLGLEPRDGLGWTASERLQRQHDFLMLAQSAMQFVPPAMRPEKSHESRTEVACSGPVPDSKKPND